MTFTLVRKLIRDVRLPLLVVMLLLAGFQILWVKATQRVTTNLAPLFQGLANAQGLGVPEMEKRIFSGPGQIVQSLVGGETIRFEKATDVMSIGYVHPLMQVLFCLWAIGRAAGAIAGELDRGTMELLLAQPVPRGRVVLAHLITDLILIPLLCLSLWAGVALGWWLIGPFTYTPEESVNLPFLAKQQIDPALLRIDVLAFGPPLLCVGAMLFAVSGLTMAFSARGRFRWWVIGQAVLVVLLMFVLNVLGQIWSPLDWVRPLTVFYYYQPQMVVLKGSWSVPLDPWGLSLRVPMLVVLFGLGAAGYLFAWRTFTRRDLPAPL